MNKEETIPEIIDIILEKEIPYNVQNVIKSYSETAVKRMMKSLAAEVIKKVQTWVYYLFNNKLITHFRIFYFK
jgi:ABC-type arginine transport system ATPase subunit